MALSQPDTPDPLLSVDLHRSLLTKSSGVFAVADLFGDIDARSNPETGVFFHDTRFLSRSSVRLNGQRGRVLRASAWEGDRSLVELEAGAFTLCRRRSLGTAVIESIEVVNNSRRRRQARLGLHFDADFRSVFEVRGAPPGQRGIRQPPGWRGSTLEFGYRGADGRARRSLVSLRPAPDRMTGSAAEFRWTLDPGEQVKVAVRCRFRDQGSGALEESPVGVPGELLHRVGVSTPEERFDAAIARSLRDLMVLSTRQQTSTFLAAGVPWFVALFGRDSLITALQLLPFDRIVAGGTLELLSYYQGQQADPWRDEEPGKILHELRVSEDANLGEVPHTPYYGTVDATPLFVTLLAEYVRWTGDAELWRRLRGSAEAALDWVLRTGDHDGDGFLDYESQSPAGLDNQGWKDSGDAIVHRDGALADPPIALVEVQAYAYRALLDAAWLFRLDGDRARAARLEEEARVLRARFRAAYWLPRRRCLALALAAGRRVETVTSNAGHALWAGILDAPIAAAVGRRLLARDMFSGWGIRTLSANELAYNPDGYQVGSIWPHDNSLIMAGLCRYGLHSEALRVFGAQVDAANAFPGHRLPEVFCGHPRGRHHRPIPYPVACHPQAWAAGSLPYMLTAILGLRPDATRGRLVLHRPRLPDWLPEVRLRQLRIGEAELDLRFFRSGATTGFEIEKRSGEICVVRTEAPWYG